MVMNKGESCPPSPRPALGGLSAAPPQQLFPSAGKCGRRTGRFCELACAQQNHMAARAHSYVLDGCKHCQGWTGWLGRCQKLHRAPQHHAALEQTRSCSPRAPAPGIVVPAAGQGLRDLSAEIRHPETDLYRKSLECDTNSTETRHRERKLASDELQDETTGNNHLQNIKINST